MPRYPTFESRARAEADLEALYVRRDKVERTQKLLRSFARVCARNDDLIDTANGLEDLAGDLHSQICSLSDAINAEWKAA